MADFFQAPDQQDPDAIRKAMLLRIFGAVAGGAPQPGLTPEAMPAKPNMTPAAGAPSSAQPGAAGSVDNSGSPRATPIMGAAPSASGGKPVAKPLAAAAANNNSGNMEPGNQPPADTPRFQPGGAFDPSQGGGRNVLRSPSNSVLSEGEYKTQEGPQPPHKPYVEPDLKHRMLMGLFAGMASLGRDPGAGERMLSSYLGDIKQKTEAEKNWPITQQEQQHAGYERYLQGKKGPLDLEDLRAQIDERQAAAWAKLHPQAKTRLVKIADPSDPHGVPALQHATGEITDQEGKVIPNAKIWEAPQKEQRPFNLDEQEFEARQALRTAKTPAERTAAQQRIEDIRASRQRPPEDRPPKESHLTPGQKATENRKYQNALDAIETERRARETGTYVHPHSGELMPAMTNDELFDRKQRAEDEYKDALEAAGETGVRRFNYRAGKYEGGEQPAADKTAKPLTNAGAGAKPNGNAAPAQHQVNDEVMYQGKRHRITAIQNGKATLQPLG